jgi:hypothetical protein
MDEIERISESAEREAFISLHANCPDKTKSDLGLQFLSIADAAVAVSKRDTSILINRTLGLGTLEPISPKTIKEIAAIHRDAGAANYFLHLYEEQITPEVSAALKDEGLEKRRGWMKFQRDMSPPKEAKTELHIMRADVSNAHHFGAIVGPCFGMTKAANPLLSGLVNDPRWHLLLSYHGDAPAGAGALFIENGCGWLEWGATNPEFRSRGSQAGIMAERIRIAIEAGCKHLFTETGEAVEGDPQHSYKNILKAGFSELQLRLNYGPAK